jgi:hypothetical protein
MSFNDRATPVGGDSDILNRVMRMVIPMKREHNRALEVRQFMHDLVYAKEIIEQAIASKDERLQESGAYLSNKMFGPRNAVDNPAIRGASTAKPMGAAASAAGTAAGKVATPQTAPEEEESEEAMRARMMSKYRNGLR